MRVTRFIFRNHLLPAFVTPFHSMRDFMTVMHPEERANIVRLSDLQAQAMTAQWEK
jgi:hypothetical protein